MNCMECEEKGIEQRMVCRFTIPIGKRSRFRTYKCPRCKHYEETFEAPTIMLPPTAEQTQTLRAGIDKAKAMRFAMGTTFKKNAPTTR
jgi:hypothetical protein